MSKTKTSTYYASLTLEKQLDSSLLMHLFFSKIADFDMSAKDFLVNDLMEMENPRFYRAEEKRIAKDQRILSRKQEGSKNYENARLKVARLYKRLYNRKKDCTHKLTRTLADEYQAIILEDFNIKGIQKFNSGLSKSVTLDFSWHQVVMFLRYKMRRNRHHLLKIDRFHPSSQICFACGEKTNHLTADMRERTYSQCGTHHDRDVNASQNLLYQGLLELVSENPLMIIHDDTTVGTTGIHASGEIVKPVTILSDLYGHVSRNEEAPPRRRGSHESPSLGRSSSSKWLYIKPLQVVSYFEALYLRV
ncbi:MAG: hypothetical protein BAJALOKI1v1_180005 [Promethearchaeota archaeon]|nr:MAG: hypothetical protein BAJALOKI1v1_180005 [Candidatus Lokiarchaeota archaeon]